MRFDTKIAIAVSNDLAVWQKLNVTAFLASGIAVGIPEVTGEPYEDSASNRYLSLFRQPVLIHSAPREMLGAAHAKALERGLAIAIFTEEMFATGNDADNRAAVRAADATKLRFAGIAVYGPRNAVDKVFKGLSLHD